MAIPQLRTPFVYVEFDSSRASQGPSLLKYQNLLIGQRTSTGTVAEAIIKKVTSADQAGLYFGVGSMLHRMAIAWFLNNNLSDCYMAALDDDGSAIDATGTFTISGAATAAGVVYTYIGGTRITAAVDSGDAPTIVGDALAAAINADTSLPVTAANAIGTVTVTAKNGGEVGNDIDLRINYNDGEVLPAGIDCAVVGMASGAANPDIQDVIDIMGDTWYNLIVCPFNDATNLTAIETELDNRFGPTKQIDGLYLTAKNGELGDLETFGNGRNSKYVSCQHIRKVPAYSADFVAAYGAVIAYNGEIDPARPFQTLELKGILAPAAVDQFTNTENNSLLFDGIATFKVIGGKVLIQRAITMYQTNAAGAVDTAYLDVVTLLTLMYLRYDFRNYILGKYPRSKLAADGTNFGSGQPVITPSIGKGEAITKFRQWEQLGLVENIDQFKTDLVCEIDTIDPNRLNWILSPNLMNQFRVGAATIQFL